MLAVFCVFFGFFIFRSRIKYEMNDGKFTLPLTDQCHFSFF